MAVQADITSTENPQVKNVAALLKKSKERREQGLFVVEGIKMFREMPLDWLYRAYVSRTFAEGSLYGEVTAVCRPVVVADSVFTAMSDTCAPQGILALVRQPSCHDQQSAMQRTKLPFFLILEDLQDPGNLGTILRTAEAAGCTGVIMSRNTVDPYNPKVIRATMGAVYRVPFLYTENPEEAVRKFKQGGVTVYAAHLKGSVSYDVPDYTGSCACMIGNESSGLTDDLVSLADFCIRIPMEGQAESLNAAVSAAVILYEAHRQRKLRNDS